MGRYIEFRPKLTARQLKQEHERLARERREAEDRAIMEGLLKEEALSRSKPAPKARPPKPPKFVVSAERHAFLKACEELDAMFERRCQVMTAIVKTTVAIENRWDEPSTPWKGKPHPAKTVLGAAMVALFATRRAGMTVKKHSKLDFWSKRLSPADRPELDALLAKHKAKARAFSRELIAGMPLRMREMYRAALQRYRAEANAERRQRKAVK